MNNAEVSAEQLRIWIMCAEDVLNEIDQHHTDVTNPEDVAHLLADLRDHKARVAEVFSTVEKHLLTLAGEKKLEVPGLGLVEIKRRTKRAKWQHDVLIPVIVARALDERVFDPVTGEAEEREAMTVARALRECISFGAGKVTGLRARGIDESEFCRVEPDGWAIQLPPRDVAA